MSEAPELLPCPFCGGTDLEILANTISCLCGANGPSQDGPEFACHDVLAKRDWNTRVPPTPAEIMADDRVRALVSASREAKMFLGVIGLDHPRCMEVAGKLDAALAAMKGDAK